MILELEELGMNARPALYNVAYDGWLLRMANGYTRRANSVHPLYGSTLPLDQKIATCEQLYAAHGLRTIFKLTEVSQPGDLEAALAARGYERDNGALIMTAPLDSTPRISDRATIARAITDNWINHYGRLNVERPEHRDILARLFGAMPTPTAYIMLALHEQVVGVAIAAFERGVVGIFGLAVDPDFHRRGLGSELVETCLAWGVGEGAHSAYLQVVDDNTPAIALYRRFHFSECYRYWYRQQPT